MGIVGFDDVAVLSAVVRQYSGYRRRVSYGDLAERSGLCHRVGQRNTLYVFRFIGLRDLVCVANFESGPRGCKWARVRRGGLFSSDWVFASHNSLVFVHT